MSTEEIWKKHLALLKEWYKLRPEFNETKNRLTQDAELLWQQIRSLEQSSSVETLQLEALRGEYEQVQSSKFALIADRDELFKHMIALETDLLNDSALH